MQPIDADAQAVRAELARVLSSPGFARNHRLADFLRFIVEARLQGRNEEIKESLIAIDVFGRRPDYDPKLDSIVRTEAGRLRSRLTEYYASDGKHDPLVIEVPKGAYVPTFLAVRRPGPNDPPQPIEGGFVGAAQRTTSRRWIAFAAAAFGVIAAVVVAGWWGSARSTMVRVAVLPIANTDGNVADEYFADGLTDEIINNLSVIEGLTVRSRTSSFAFKNHPRDIRQTGKLLDVDYILEGAAVRSNDRVRINTQLVRVRDDVPVWSGRYDRPVIDVIAIQNEISLGIVNNLRLHLGEGRRRYEASAEAYDLYLRARELTQENPPGSEWGVDAYQRTIEKDPSFAPAYAGLATGYAIRSIQFAVEHPADELTRMRLAADKALELDPFLADAYAARGMIDARDGQWDQAEKNFRRSLEIDPNRSATRHDFAMWLLLVLGRGDEAIREMQLAARNDPLADEIQVHLAYALIDTGRYDEAAAICARLSREVPFGARSQCIARSQFWKGSGGAVDVLAHASNLEQNPQNRGYLGYLYARIGRRDEAERMAAASRYANERALIYAGLGDKDRLIEALEGMAALGPQRIGLMLNEPELALLRGDPRLRQLRDKVGLP